MNIKKLKIKNFRGYKDEVEIEFGNLTAFVGKNDIGKSSILEALDIFFNEGKGVVKFDKDDVNKQASIEGGDSNTIISVCFDNLPNTIVIDSTNETTLQAEYLLNSDDLLEIIKYPTAGTTADKVFVKANHPTNPNCKDLLSKLQKKLHFFHKIQRKRKYNLFSATHRQ